MGSEIGVQLLLIETERRGLAAGHRLLDGFNFLLHPRSGLRACGDHRRVHGVKDHQQCNDSGGVSCCPADDAEEEAQGLGLRGGRESERVPLLGVAVAFTMRFLGGEALSPIQT